MKKEYNKLKKKFSLPKLKDINKDFQISTIDTKTFLLKEIARKMNEKAELFSNLMEEILNPDNRLSTLHESSNFNDQGKKEVLKTYRKLLFNQRKNSYLEISYDEKETAKHINSFFNEWQLLKPTLRKIIIRMKDSWNHDKKTKLELSYFG